jgi:hypothetical protein
MDDSDVIHELPHSHTHLDHHAFLVLVPTWPAWLHVHPASAVAPNPNQLGAFHTRHGDRHYALVPSPASNPPNLTLYAVWHGLVSSSWSPIHRATTDDPSTLAHTLRRDLPALLSNCDLSHIKPDGGLDEEDRRFEGARLLRKPYERWSDTWDHDHCVYCWATFSLDTPGALTKGYAVQDDPTFGDDYSWICVSCVNKRRGLVAYDILND